MGSHKNFSKRSVVIIVKQKINQRIHESAILRFYILQKIT
jgi:hypothetical protein